MLEFYTCTHEEAICRAIEQNPSTAGVIIASQDNDRIKVRIYFEYEVSAKYAKAVLSDYINKTDGRGGQHVADT